MINLVPYWKQLPKFVSVRFAIALGIWNAIPVDIWNEIPELLRLGVSTFLLGGTIVGTIIKQKNVNTEEKDNGSNRKDAG